MAADVWNDGQAASADDSEPTEVFDAFVAEDGDAGDWFGSAAPNDARELTGDVVTGGRSLRSEPEPLMERDAKGGIPNIGEWENFFGNVLIRLATDFYIELAFRDIDEDLLSDREVERIKLAKEERNRIARPFAEYSNKSKFMRKHGRMIIASGDSIDAIIQLGMWFGRVNRVARKYRGTHRVKPQRGAASPVFRIRPDPPAEQQQPIPHAPQTGETESVSFGSSEKPPSTIRPEGWRPDIAGTVFNPGG